MKRKKSDSDKKLKFKPRSGLMYEAAECVNHGLELHENKLLWSMGLYTIGYLKTDKGRKIEAARRKSGSYQIHLGSSQDYEGKNKEPISIYPDTEPNDEITIPDNFFQPYFNCHGLTFADSEYWINPVVFERMPNGSLRVVSENIKILLEDEYVEVNSNDIWTVAVLFNSNNEIVHSVKREKDRIFCKYDGYQLEKYKTIEEVEIDRYNGGNFKFYKYR